MNKSRWDEIIAVSARLFREKGYRATTMEDIARELHVTKPALYYYIDTKQDLLYAICDSAINQLLKGVRRIDASVGDPEEKLNRLVKWHVNMFARQGDVINVYLADEGELPADRREHVCSLSREFESIYRRVIEQAVAEGRFRPVDVPIAVRAISGMCNWLSSWYRPDGRLSADEIARIFLDLMLEGCRERRR